MTRKAKFPQILLIGGTGQTGHRILEQLAKSGDCTRVVATSRFVSAGLPDGRIPAAVAAHARDWGDGVVWQALDLESAPGDLARQLSELDKALEPEVATAVILGAAFTDVDGCERDPAKCARVNETNTLALLDWVGRRGAKPVLFSTDYVFDGEAGPYSESATPNPVCVYGRSKAVAETALLSRWPGALVIRTTGIFDYLPGSMNFLMQMLQAAEKGSVRKLPVDQLGTPVAAEELARATLELISADAAGVYHVAGATLLDRPAFARLIFEVFGTGGDQLIQPVRTAELGQLARRPLRGGLLADKLRRELGWAPSSAREALERLREYSKTLHA